MRGVGADGDVGGAYFLSVKVVNSLGLSRLKVGAAAAHDDLAVHDNFFNFHFFDSADNNKVRAVAFLQKAYVKLVMLDWIIGGRAQNVKGIVALGDKLFDQAPKKALLQVVGMQVVHAKHKLFRGHLKKRSERLKIFCGGALADLNEHSALNFFQALFVRGAFVVGGNARRRVFF